MFNWLLENLSENDRTLFCQFKKCGKILRNFYRRALNLWIAALWELADDIAYGVHDLEDAIVTGVVNPHQWQAAHSALKQIPSAWLQENIDSISQRLFSDKTF